MLKDAKTEKTTRKRPVEGLRTNPHTRRKMNRNERRDAQQSLRSFVRDHQSFVEEDEA